MTGLAVTLFTYKDSKKARQLVDIMKQIFGQLFAHGLNILIAYILVDISKSESEDECKWYLINYLLDTLVGVAMCYGFIRLQCYIADKCLCPKFRSGNYLSIESNSINKLQCVFQITSWLTIILLTKLLILCIILIPLHQYLGDLGDFLVHPLIDYPKIELVVVMIIVPLIMNVCQFWIQDLFLRDKKIDTDESCPLYSKSSNGQKIHRTITDINGLYFVTIEESENSISNNRDY